MVYVKQTNMERKLAAVARDILQGCQAITLAELTQRLGVTVGEAQKALLELVSLGYVEQLRPVGRLAPPQSTVAADSPAEVYYRLIRRGDADFAGRCMPHAPHSGRHAARLGDRPEVGHLMMRALKGGA